MFKKSILAAVAITFSISSPFALAEEVPPPPSDDCCKGMEKPKGMEMSKEMKDAFDKMSKVSENHKRLDFMVGEWNTTTKIYWAPKAPPEVSKGKCTVKKIMDGRYYQSNYSGSMMGKPFTGMSITGYDNVNKEFVNSWIDNASTHMLVAKGNYDPKTKTFTYKSKMNDCMKPSEMVGVKEVIKIVSPTEHVFEMYEKKDGKESKTMEVTYKKK